MKPYQTEVWHQKDGTPIKLEDMSLQHLQRTVAMLDRRAAIIEREATFKELLVLIVPVPTVIGENNGEPVYAPPSQWSNSMPRGEMAVDAFEGELDERARNPVRWLHTLPLVKRMDALIAEKMPNPHAPGSPDWEIWEDKH